MKIQLEDNLAEKARQLGDDLSGTMVLALQATLDESVNYLRSFDYSRGSQQGAKIRTGPSGPYYYYSHALPLRKPHPGGWADVTGNLSNQYGKEDARQSGGDVIGTLFNLAEYASDLEGNPRRLGGIYWVLAGINPGNRLGIQPEFDISEVFARNLESQIDGNE